MLGQVAPAGRERVRYELIDHATSGVLVRPDPVLVRNSRGHALSMHIANAHPPPVVANLSPKLVRKPTR